MLKKNISGYYLTQKEKIERGKPPIKGELYVLESYEPSDAIELYFNNSQKIELLLMISQHTKEINLTIEEKRIFATTGHVIYSQPEDKLSDILKSGKSVLIEQSIVKMISNVESYFSSIFEAIFNDDKYLQHHISKLNAFLCGTKLIDELIRTHHLNGQSYKNLNYGTYALNKRKISFQQLDTIKKFLKLFPDVKSQIKDEFWTNYNEYADERHCIVHKAKAKRYELGKIDKILDAKDIFDKTIELIDFELFNTYPFLQIKGDVN